MNNSNPEINEDEETVGEFIPDSPLSKYASARLEEIGDNLEAAQIYRELVNGVPINEIARDLKLSVRTLEEKLRTVGRWTSQDAAFQRENWMTITINRTEIAMRVILKKIRAYELDDAAEIDWRVFDKLESLVKTQAAVMAQTYGSKNSPAGMNVNNNVFLSTMTGESKLYKIANAREQEREATNVMPILQPYNIESHPELDLINDSRGIPDSDGGEA